MSFGFFDVITHFSLGMYIPGGASTPSTPTTPDSLSVVFKIIRRRPIQTILRQFSVDQRTNRFMILGIDQNLVQKIDWSIVNDKITDENYHIINAQTPLLTTIQGVTSENIFDFQVVLPNNLKLKLKVRFMKNNGDWSEWSDYLNFTTDDTDFKSDSLLISETKITKNYSISGAVTV